MECQHHHHHGHHDHGHSHHHHDHAIEPGTVGRFIGAIALNLIFVAAEYFLAFRYDSAGLLADASHNLGDVGGLVISLTAFYMLRKRSDERFTYGYKKATVLAAFLNSLILLGVVVLIVWECIEKFRFGSAPAGGAIMAAAGGGIAVNGFTVWLLRHGKENDLNIKSAYWHMLGDTLVSLGVVIAGALVMMTNWTWLDPAVGLVIAIIILAGSREVLQQSWRLLLDGVPSGVDAVALQQEIRNVENVEDLHHLHIWAISTVENALSCHIVLKNSSLQEDTRKRIKQLLAQHRLEHSVLEFEAIGSRCCDKLPWGC